MSWPAASSLALSAAARPKAAPSRSSGTRHPSGSSGKSGGDQWAAEHESLPCADCTGADRAWAHKHWKPAPDQRNAYANEVAGALVHGIKNEGDIHRNLYGLLTGRCGRCGRLLWDPESKRLGLGPDCRGYR